jgi:nucleoid DNA-binding protein
VTKKKIVQTIVDQTRIDQAVVKDVVQRCLDTIIDITASQGRLELRNFGVFQVKRRAARKARNPRTNEEVHVPEKVVLTFQAGKNVTKRIRQSSARDALGN